MTGLEKPNRKSLLPLWVYSGSRNTDSSDTFLASPASPYANLSKVRHSLRVLIEHHTGWSRLALKVVPETAGTAPAVIGHPSR